MPLSVQMNFFNRWWKSPPSMSQQFDQLSTSDQNVDGLRITIIPSRTWWSITPKISHHFDYHCRRQILEFASNRCRWRPYAGGHVLQEPTQARKIASNPLSHRSRLVLFERGEIVFRREMAFYWWIVEKESYGHWLSIRRIVGLKISDAFVILHFWNTKKYSLS